MSLGVLTLVATPIGNLGDLSPRAAEELAGADLICCEDTRRTGRLLELAGLARRPLRRVDDHTEADTAGEVIDRLGRGERVVLVTDAGTPGVADPGARLVAAVLDAGGEVTLVPGPSAPVAALVLSGLDTSRWVMEGFLPRRAGPRRHRLAELATEARTLVLLESPHRVAATVDDLARSFGGERRVALARELTKLHEEVWRGTLDEAVVHLAAAPPRGEYVVVVAGADDEEVEVDDDDLRRALDVELAAGSSRRDAAAAVALRFGVPRRRVYDLTIGS